MVSGLFRTSIWTDSGSRPHENGFSSVAAVGFALTSYAVGVERGWLSRASAVERTLTTLRFFDRSPQSEHRSNTTGYRGFYYHFIDPETGFRYRQVELSTIDTALLMAGVLFAGEYYQSSDPEEQEIPIIGGITGSMSGAGRLVMDLSMGPSPISEKNVDFGPIWHGEFRLWSSVTTEPWLLPLRVGACPLPRIGSSPLLSI